ncbi:MAG: hypothetical protein ISQ46_06315 [Methylophilaceae bacterium]|jgi:hypothetical protein|nr:hypothetical protein [Methylophilaceae bacterium]
MKDDKAKNAELKNNAEIGDLNHQKKDLPKKNQLDNRKIFFRSLEAFSDCV